MVDREKLATTREVFGRIYAILMAVPFMLVVVGRAVQGSQSASSEPSVRAIVMLAVAAIVPLVAVPLIRMAFRRRLSAISPNPTAGEPTLGSQLAIRTFMEYACWEAASLFGFVAVILGAPIEYLYGAAVFAFVGVLISYPRASAWEACADALDEMHRRTESVPGYLDGTA